MPNPHTFTGDPEFVDDFRKIAPDKYYTFGSNYYLGYQGIKEGMDYFTTCRIGGEGWGKYKRGMYY